jgi:hypothetical protein
MWITNAATILTYLLQIAAAIMATLAIYLAGYSLAIGDYKFLVLNLFTAFFCGIAFVMQGQIRDEIRNHCGHQ